ncbi:ATP-grasp domain-containing protein [Virgibacillus sp. YIM 98842]|uniref:ATP-binding protein n=1 Tax=Virgibacillus sp. YIM 98842 TaxID=2663533 RepID=UPI0013DBCE70|nr:ATP-grasp domain-containing protein [Virgibacillus sp. YIM 98842]
MAEKDYEWLPHLEDCIPNEGKGYSLSMYSIALEAWRRGITVKFYNNTPKKSQIRYSLSYQGKEYFFTVSRGSIVPREAVKICINKQLTKEYLMEAGVPTPAGTEFTGDSTEEEILKYAQSLGYPLVIKPSNGTGGHGVIANIKNEAEFKSALDYVRNDLKYSNVIVEKFSIGVDHRVFVIDGKVIGAFRRIPANVVGDGVNNIKYLLRLKNKERNKNPSLNGLPITIDKEVHNTLKQNGYTLETVPEKGKRVFLKTKNNVSSGGDSTDATEELSEEVKEIAVNAAKAIPGLVQCGIDMVINNEKNTGEILEINSRPAIRNHLFPMVGKARDIPKAIVDYYFPQSEKIKTTVNYYFDFDVVADNFRRRFTEEFLIPPMPTENVQAKKLLITGDLLNSKFDTWILRQARKLKVDGHLKHIENEKVSIVVAGKSEAVANFENIINEKIPSKFKIKNISLEEWKKPIKYGFEIVNSGSKVKKIPTSKKYWDLKEQLEEIKRERDFYKQEVNKIENSTSWKITSPIRMAGSIIKSKK